MLHHIEGIKMNWENIIKSIPIEKCDAYDSGCKNDAAMFSTINCMKVCQECYEEYMNQPVRNYKGEEMKRPMAGWKPFTVEEFRQKCMIDTKY